MHQSSPERQAAGRPRARDLGIAPGLFPPGRLNAITDVAGVQVGHATVEATEEAVLKSLLRAVTTTGNGRTVEAIAVDHLLALLTNPRTFSEKMP